MDDVLKYGEKRYVAEFDRLELKAALEAGKIPASEHNIGRLDGFLRTIAQQYRARKIAGRQGLNSQLTRLEKAKDFLGGLWDTEPLLHGFETETGLMIARLSGTVQRATDFLKNERNKRRVRRDDPETILFMDLRDVYVGLSGKTGISQDGPLRRFANACAKLIDVNIILPQPQSLRKALKRRAKATSYFRLQQEDLKGIH